MALKKSEDTLFLFKHCFIIYIVLFIGTFNPLFALINAATHALIDWNIWRAYKKGKSKNFKFWTDRWFYTTLGFDQLIHTSVLILSWTLLNGGIK